MARVNEGSHSFTCHPRLSTSGMNHTCLYSPAAEHHRTLADSRAWACLWDCCLRCAAFMCLSYSRRGRVKLMLLWFLSTSCCGKQYLLTARLVKQAHCTVRFTYLQVIVVPSCNFVAKLLRLCVGCMIYVVFLPLIAWHFAATVKY